MARAFDGLIDHTPVVCVPVPGCPGHFMPCHVSVRVSCPRCKADPMEPCKTNRGSLVLTGAMVDTIKRLAHHERVTQGAIQDVRDRVARFEPSRGDCHDERRENYRAMPEAHAPRRKRALHPPGLSKATLRELRALLKYADRYGEIKGDG